MLKPRTKKILFELKQVLKNYLDDNLEKVILFGSRASKHYKSYSDYDILIVLKNDYDWKYENKIIEICYELCLKYNILIDLKLISKKEINSPRGEQFYVQNALLSGINI